MGNSAHLWGAGPRVMLTHAEEKQANERDFVPQLLPVFPAVKAFWLYVCGARLPGLGSVRWQGDVPESQGCGQ